jgi:3-phenylpropionate/trans-cinnamate dioxygenase ferredoxin component
VHLCDALVMDHSVECPKHGGVFDYRTGEATRAPACINLKTFAVKVEDGSVYIEI